MSYNFPLNRLDKDYYIKNKYRINNRFNLSYKKDVKYADKYKRPELGDIISCLYALTAVLYIIMEFVMNLGICNESIT